MKAVGIIIGIIVLIAVVGIVGVFALTGEAGSFEPKAFFSSVEGDVEYQTSQSPQWIEAQVNVQLFQGDRIKTGENSSAELSFYDNSTSRLDSNTEILLDTLSVNPDNTEDQKINIQLFGGRVWSRIIKLLDRDAEFTVTSSDTVATVRGTALDVQVDDEGTQVIVDENTVEVTTIETEEEVNQRTGEIRLKIKERLAQIDVQEGNQVKVLRAALPRAIEDFNVEDASLRIRADGWLRENKVRDVEFLAVIEERVSQRLENDAGPLPGTALYGIKRAAENVRLNLASDTAKDQLELRFAEARLREGQLLERAGEVERGQELIQQFENTIDRHRDRLDKLSPEVRDRIENRIDDAEQVRDKLRLQLEYDNDEVREEIEDRYKRLHADEARERLNDFIQEHPDALENPELRDEIFGELRFLDQDEREIIKDRFEVRIDEFIESNPDIDSREELREFIEANPIDKQLDSPRELLNETAEEPVREILVDRAKEFYNRYLSADHETRQRIKERASQELTSEELQRFKDLISTIREIIEEPVIIEPSPNPNLELEGLLNTFEETLTEEEKQLQVDVIIETEGGVIIQ